MNINLIHAKVRKKCEENWSYITDLISKKCKVKVTKIDSKISSGRIVEKEEHLSAWKKTF